MEQNILAIIIGYLIILLAVISIIVAIIGAIVSAELESTYAVLGEKIIPNKLNKVFGYNGRVFSISQFNTDYGKTFIDNPDIKTNAIKMLENKEYLIRKASKERAYSYYLLNDIFHILYAFAVQPNNKGLYVIHNTVSKRYGCPALFPIANSRKEKFYLATL